MQVARPVEEKLHMGLGIRRPDLGRFLAQPSVGGVTFAERLGILLDEDSEWVILAKAILQLTPVIDRIPCAEKKWVTVLRAVYNLDQNPGLDHRVLKDRLVELHKRNGRGWHPSTTNSKLSELWPYLHSELKTRRFSWPNQQEIDALAESERRYAESRASGQHALSLPADPLGLMIANLRGTGRATLEHTLPQVELHFAVSTNGNLVTASTTEFGENLPAFTSNTLLRQYQDRVQAPATDTLVAASGRTIIDVLASRGGVGLAVNPLGGHGADTGEYWTPEELAAL
jgi:hypothetical protein